MDKIHITYLEQPTKTMCDYAIIHKGLLTYNGEVNCKKCLTTLIRCLQELLETIDEISYGEDACGNEGTC